MEDNVAACVEALEDITARTSPCIWDSDDDKGTELVTLK